jgi:glycosyltransferase involved in cell wall biosynthesis
MVDTAIRPDILRTTEAVSLTEAPTFIGRVAQSYPLEPGISVVIPARNEERNLDWVLGRLPSYVDEVILVDGDSTDRTVEVARALRPDIRVVGQDRPGKGAALQAGFAAATKEFVVMLDADGSMDPQEIDRYISQLQNGAEMVKGSRRCAGGGSHDISALRSFGNAFFVTTANLLYGAKFTDICYGYVAFRRSAIPRLALDADGFEIETQIVVRSVKAGLVIEEVPSFELPRRFGTSNLNTWRDGFRVLRTLVRERFVSAVAEPALVPVGVIVEEAEAA